MTNWVPLCKLLARRRRRRPVRLSLRSSTARPAAVAGLPTPTATPNRALRPAGLSGGARVPHAVAPRSLGRRFVRHRSLGVLVLVLACHCGVFSFVWIFIQAAFIKKIRPASNLIMLYVIAVVAGGRRLSHLPDLVDAGSAGWNSSGWADLFWRPG